MVEGAWVCLRASERNCEVLMRGEGRKARKEADGKHILEALCNFQLEGYPRAFLGRLHDLNLDTYV